MKKLKLIGAQALTREQQRSINGGTGGSGECTITCENGLKLDGGPICPTQSNINDICKEIGGTTPGSCTCDAV
ncbi:MAG: hypothetical protein KDC67_06190 [Ignavibacteriae bacterium]|nr:hypothetical protein [Ignavibacteriota bacterium]